MATDSGCSITVKCQFAELNGLPVIGSVFLAAAASADIPQEKDLCVLIASDLKVSQQCQLACCDCEA